MEHDRDSLNAFLYDALNMAGLFCESDQQTQELIRLQKLNLFLHYSIFSPSDELRQQWLPDGKLFGLDYRIEFSLDHNSPYTAFYQRRKIHSPHRDLKKLGISESLLLLWKKLNPNDSLKQLADKLNIPEDPFETIPGFQMTTCPLFTSHGETFFQLARIGQVILPITGHTLHYQNMPQFEPMEIYSCIPPISTGIPAFLQKGILEVQDELPVILSDCPRLVHRSSHTDNDKYRYTRTTFWGGDFAIDRLAWSCFRGRRVYYLLFKHSKKTTGQTLKTAYRILQKLQEAQAQEVQFISYLSEQDFLSYSNDFLFDEFHFWDKNKFMSIYSNYCEWQQKLKAAHVKWHQASAIHQPMPQNFLIFPLLPVGGMVAIDGAPQSYKTDVALSLAFATAFNRKIFDRYETGKMGASSGNVLYLHGDNHQSALSTKLMWLVRRHIDENFSDESLFAHFPIDFEAFPKDKFETIRSADNIYFSAVSAKQA